MKKKIVHLLMIEDSFGDARLIYEMLRDSSTIDFKIEQAFRLHSGIEMLRNKEFDIVLLDLALPDSFGLDTLKSIIAEARGIPIVVMTSNDDEELGIKAVHLGAQDYIMKLQYDSYSLVKAICFAIERKQNEELLANQTKLLDKVNENVTLLETIIDNTNTLLACLDENFNLIRMNRAFANLGKSTPELLQGKNFFKIFPGIITEELFRKVVKSGNPCTDCSTTFDLCEDAERKYWDWRLVPIKDSTGKTIRLVLSLQDVTNGINEHIPIAE